MKGRVLYLIEFRREAQLPNLSHVELPADQLTAAKDQNFFGVMSPEGQRFPNVLRIRYSGTART